MATYETIEKKKKSVSFLTITMTFSLPLQVYHLPYTNHAMFYLPLFFSPKLNCTIFLTECKRKC